MRLLSLVLLPLSLVGEDAERVCKLKIAWWNAPSAPIPPVLALGIDVKNPREFAPQVMNFGTEARCTGETANFVIKRTSKDPKTGKEVVSWEPFASTRLPPGDDTLGVVMVSDAATTSGQARVFQMGAATFPFGTVRLVNLTGRELMLALDGQNAKAVPSGVVTHPRIFKKDQVAEISVFAAINQEMRPVFTTKSEFSPSYRLVLFVVEIPQTNPPQFEVRTIVDFPQPETKPVPVKKSTDAKLPR